MYVLSDRQRQQSFLEETLMLTFVSSFGEFLQQNIIIFTIHVSFLKTFHTILIIFVNQPFLCDLFVYDRYSVSEILYYLP